METLAKTLHGINFSLHDDVGRPPMQIEKKASEQREGKERGKRREQEKEKYCG